MPKWKRIKDPFLTRLFYRPVSFFCASVCANHGISANTVSYLSAIVAVLACILFIPNNYCCNITGAVLCNVWLIMDCIDGNLARGVKKQPFGVFADSMSSYILVGFVVTAIGYCAYQNGGLLITAGTPWIILIGAIASTSDTMMRLIYQKYKATERELQDKGIMESEYDVRLDNDQTNNWRVRLESDWGIGGILPLLILLGTIFNALDIVILYCVVYYVGSFVVMTLLLVRKALKAQHTYTIE
ncbi:MAG: CDP-alcohol phosphatidyltransferase family protein [Prevotella sp.]|nr:CDP-alcohol phosphatidyltransferase family protein [Prevotella sp.]